VKNVKTRGIPRNKKFRGEIDALINAGDLRGLLDKAGDFYGHLCNYLAYGVMAGYVALRELEVESSGTGEVVAIVETNDCFSDGVKLMIGCSFGGSNLIYRDLGKSAVTVVKKDGTAIRTVLNPNFEDSRKYEYPEAYELRNKLLVQEKEATPEEYQRMVTLFAEMAFNELNKPTTAIFKTERKKVEMLQHTSIPDSVRCSFCAENVKITRIRVRESKPSCINCAQREHFVLDGRGISREISGERVVLGSNM
jgi:formylmethanofuran dehydrogenase subunit E